MRLLENSSESSGVKDILRDASVLYPWSYSFSWCPAED